MYSIYFENRSVNICGEHESSLGDPNSVIFCPGGEPDFRKLVATFESNPGIHRIYVPSNDPEGMFGKFCGCFRQISAGGGLVENRRGDYLMIRRNGLWDLPKGKQEDGEPIGVTALREVREETGLQEIEPGELICITRHCYRWKGEGDLILKHTWWYSMDYTIPTELIPQTEEDITKACWVAKSSLPSFLAETYPSIIQVFREAGII